MADIEFVEQDSVLEPHIKVVGVGGGGCNAVDGMVDFGVENVEFYVINTDIQALNRAKCSNKLQIGKDITHGRGAGSDPNVGGKAAINAKDTITEMIMGADMLFLTAGFGGGTGTGATPVIAEIARELGILTIAFITRPFRFEGPQRSKRADIGISHLRESCDTLVVTSNERLLEVVGNKATLQEAFAMANNVLAQGVKSISDLISVPGLINVDFGDVRAIMTSTGGAVMGVGVGKGENRAIEAVKKACSNPLLDKNVIDGATGILLCISGGESLKLDEINQATSAVYEAADPDVNITLGVVIEPELGDEIKVTIIATGFPEDPLIQEAPDEKEEKRTVFQSKKKEEKSEPHNVSLKEKLTSILGPESELKKEEQKSESPKEENGFFGKVAEENFEVNFNKPGNPLRRYQKQEALEEQEVFKEELEDDLESPAFLRRRKSLFD
jgi:cell division protein FtsZ